MTSPFFLKAGPVLATGRHNPRQIRVGDRDALHAARPGLLADVIAP
jgi:hypothetical protein